MELKAQFGKTSLLRKLYRLKLLGIYSLPKSQFKAIFNENTDRISLCSSCKYLINPPRCDRKIVVVGDYSYDDSPFKMCSLDEVDLLKRMLEAIGLRPEEVYFTSAVKCKGHDQEFIKCKEIILSEFGSSDSYCILSFGSILYTLLFDEKKDILQIRNRVYTHGNKRIVFTLRPSDILSASGNQQKELKRLVWEDLKLFKGILS